MKSRFFAIILFGMVTAYMATPSCGVPPLVVATWSDPELAAAESPDFLLQGEYVTEGKGLQVAAMGQSEFHLLTYQGGLPGAGWDGGSLKAEKVDGETLSARLKGFERVQRTSPTEGRQAPEGAKVIFTGEQTEHFKGKLRDGLLWDGTTTTEPVGDFLLHLEFRLPFKPDRSLGSQDRGNSGVYVFGNYEIQVIDSFGLDFVVENNAVKPASHETQWCGSFYKVKTPDVAAIFPPLQWQTYDIEFTAPRFKEGKKVSNARFTVRHNGVLIHDDVELEQGTGAGAKRAEKEKGTIHFQEHGNPVAFRNVWLLERTAP